MDKIVLKGKSCFCPCLCQAPWQGNLGSVCRHGLEVRVGKSFLEKWDETHHKDIRTWEKRCSYFMVSISLFFPGSPPVAGARRRLQGWRRKKGLSGSFPFQRVPCLLGAPAGILGIHLHTFNSTSFPEKQLRPICSFFPLLQQALAA